MTRRTTRKVAIEDVFRRAGRPLTVPEAHLEAQSQVPGLGVATVYRAVAEMVEQGVLRPVELPGESARYELKGLAHHHHFHCHACGRVFDVPGCPGRLADLGPSGFEVTGHEIILYGRCAECAAGAPA